MRDAVNAAANAEKTAGNVGAGLGANAQTIGSQLIPNLTRNLNAPPGYSQQDVGSMLTAAEAAAGGATSGLAGAASKNAATSRSPMGFSAALDAAAMQRDKAAAGASEGIAANNANLKQTQMANAQKGLEGLYGTNVAGSNQAYGQQAPDINAQANANNTGWAQTTSELMKAFFPKGL